MGISEPVLKAIRRKGYRLPTPIQRRSLPLIMQVLVLARPPPARAQPRRPQKWRLRCWLSASCTPLTLLRPP